MDKRFEADCNEKGDWFVFDNEGCYCVAGPMDEEKAIDMAIEMNRQTNGE